VKQHPRFQITSKQLAFFIITSLIGTGVFTLPRATSDTAAQDAWISVLLGCLAPLLTLFLIERLMRQFPDLTVVELGRRLFGRAAGTVLAAGFILYLVGLGAFVLREFLEIVALYMLPRTPLWATGFILLVTVVYAVSKGAKALSRFNELIVYIVFFALLIVLIPLLKMDVTNILPVGGAGLPAILKGSLASVLSYAGVDMLFVVYPMVGRKDEVMKASALGLGFVVLAYSMITFITLLVLGSETVEHILFPLFQLLKSVEIPVVERLELFFILLWLGLGPRPLFNLALSASFSLVQLLCLDLDRSYPAAVIGVGLLIYILALLPHDFTEVHQFGEYVGYAYLAAGIGYPAVLHIAAYLKGGGSPHG
jgi:spore germination protein